MHTVPCGSQRDSVLNLFDKPPPLDLQTYGGGGGAPFDGAFHDAGAVGRFCGIGATYTFYTQRLNQCSIAVEGIETECRKIASSWDSPGPIAGEAAAGAGIWDWAATGRQASETPNTAPTNHSPPRGTLCVTIRIRRHMPCSPSVISRRF